MKYYGIDFIDDFLYEKSINQGLSSETIKTYKTVFNRLCANPYLDITDFSSFTEMNFKRFLGELQVKNKWSSYTYNRYRKNCKIFCDYLIRNKFLKENPLKNIPIRKIDKTLPKYLNKTQIKKFIKTIEETFYTKDFFAIRNKTIIYTYLFTGIRLNELIKLKLNDVNFLDGTILINKGKGGKDRIVPIVSKLSDFLLKFEIIKKQLNIKSEALFPTRYKGYMQHRDIYEIVKKIREKLDFKFTPHMLRHTFATECVRKNINLYDISKILGHSNVKTTQIYLGLDIQNARCNLEKVKLYL